jgi:molecular chaperone GrpE
VSKNQPARTDRAEEPGPEKADAVDRPPEGPPSEALMDAAREALENDPLLEEAGPIEKLRAELEETKDRALRTQAELENYRKRVARQMQEERRYADLPLIRDLLPVWDNMGRAIEAAENTHQAESLLEGFKMVAAQLESVLERHHCTKIEALGEPFDPNLHEAISQQPSDEHPANTVLHVAQTGFRLHDRVVRPTQVIVSATVPETPQPIENEDPQPEQQPEPKSEAG